ncbi:MAG: amidohydrolase 2 [Rhodospirillales bacterium]|nr:amidohydrolase 2 [Rhodospirillales bacterium]
MAASDGYRFIDSDTHLTEPPDVWTARVPARWKDKVPHVRWVEETKSDSWFVGDKKMFDVGGSANAGWPEPFPSHPPTLADAHPASYDASARLKYMDSIGCWAQVVYPNVGGFGSQEFLKMGDSQLMLACVQAYNDFQRDWASPDPRRFVTMIALPFWNVEQAVKEIERSAKNGHKGVLFTAAPQDYGLPVLADHHWDPLWAAAQDHDLPISFHIGSGDFLDEAKDNYTPKRLKADGWAATYARTTTNLLLSNAMQLGDLLLSGVLPRYPNLKFVSVESGIGWIPFLLESTDYHFDAAAMAKSRPEFKMKPSEYFQRQVYGCYWFEKGVTDQLLNKVGVDKIMFETDFPHVTCLYGNIDESIEAGIGDKSDAIKRKILFDNAAGLYKIALN